MSRLGRTCAAVAAVVGFATVALWDGGAQRASSGVAVDGAALFRAKGCAACHDGPDSTAAVGGLPSLREAAEWAGDRRPATTAEAYLTESIADPSAFISPAFAGGVGATDRMPDLAVTDDEIDALVDYLLAG